SAAKRPAASRRPVRGSARSRRARRREGPGPIRSTGARVARHLSPRAADVIGVALIVLGILTVLGLWFGSGGAFGSWMKTAVRSVFGVVGYAFPVIALAWSVVLIRGTNPEDRGRMLVGLWILALG